MCHGSQEAGAGHTCRASRAGRGMGGTASLVVLLARSRAAGRLWLCQLGQHLQHGAALLGWSVLVTWGRRMGPEERP